MLIKLAGSGDTVVSARDLAAEMDIPYRFLEQVIRDLRQSGFVKSYRGFKGGYKLAKNAAKINLLEVVEKLHGPIELVPCMANPANCKLTSICGAHNVWATVDKGIRSALGFVTLDRLTNKGKRKSR